MSAAIVPQESNNHRKLGRELGLFTFSSEVGSGLPLWLPKGAILRDTLERFLRQEQLERGYQPVITPHIGKIELYKTSGHWYKYRESIFPPMVAARADAEERDQWTHFHDSCAAPSFGHAFKAEEDGPDELDDIDGEAYILKPMNCPHHIHIYKSEPRSYRELPLRLAEFGTVYRYEQSGELNGLLRTRDFTVDDAHIFVTPAQVEEEFINVIKLALFVFEALQLDDFSARLGLRDPASSKYIGSDEAWEEAQRVIMSAIEKLGIPYHVEKGEAGFYGPKLDFLFRDALDRQWQLGTAQVDYNLPERFDLSYVGEDGQSHRPVMIHRANFGSMERMIAILLEHHGGAFPAWLAPVQAKLIPISDRHMAYAQEVAAQIRAAGVRVEVDTRSERMNAKVRDAQLQKIPYILVVGDKEVAQHAVSVRLRTNENLGAMLLASFVERVTNVIKTKSRDL
jgi:threonyl-tRNA synthetase